MFLPPLGDDPDVAPNVISVRHWRRLLDGVLLARSPRLDWPTLLRRTFDVDALSCARCGGRLRPLDVVAEPEEARRILKLAGLPSEPPPLARARDPTEE